MKQYKLTTSFLLVFAFMLVMNGNISARSYKLEKAKKTYDEDIKKAKINYEKDLELAKENLLKAYDVAIADAMKKASLKLANKYTKAKQQLLTGVDGNKNKKEKSKQEVSVRRPSYVPEGSVYFNKNWYYVSETTLTFIDAFKQARKMNGKLVVISSLEENEFVFNLAKKSVWINLIHKPAKKVASEDPDKRLFNFGDVLGKSSKSKKSYWKVSDKYKPAFLNWAEGQPYEYSTENTYAYMHKSYDGQWYASKNTNFYAVFEFGTEKNYQGKRLSLR